MVDDDVLWLAIAGVLVYALVRRRSAVLAPAAARAVVPTPQLGAMTGAASMAANGTGFIGPLIIRSAGFWAEDGSFTPAPDRDGYPINY